MIKKGNWVKFNIAAGLVIIVLGAAYTHFVLPNLSLQRKAKNFSAQFRKDSFSLLNGFSGKFTFVIDDMRNPFLKVAHEEERGFPAASLIKVPLMVAALFAVEEKKYVLGDKFLLTRKDITGGSGILKKSPLPREITLKELVKLMVSRSDNTAANKIIDILGFDYINKVFIRLGLDETVLNRKIMDFKARREGIENYISCQDLVSIFEKIHKKEMISPYYSELMFVFLREQKINDRIPRYLPQSVTVAHKTGLERNSVGDVGIVHSGCGDYAVCAIVSDFSDYKTAKDFIAKLSLVVYNAFETAVYNKDVCAE